MKTLKEIIKELQEKGYQELPEGCVTGEEFEEWLRRKRHSWITRDGGIAIECEKCGIYVSIYDTNYKKIQYSECNN